MSVDPSLGAGLASFHPPLARLFRMAEVTEGSWNLNSHWSFPVTPLYADFEYGRHQKVGRRAPRSSMTRGSHRSVTTGA
jgi:hypothetical protein